MSGKNAYKKNERQQHRKELEKLRSTDPGQYRERLRQLFDSWWAQMLRELRTQEPGQAFDLFDKVRDRAGREHGDAFQVFVFSNHMERVLDEIAGRVCQGDLSNAWVILDATRRHTRNGEDTAFHQAVLCRLERAFDVELSRRIKCGKHAASELVGDVIAWLQGGLASDDPGQVEAMRLKVQWMQARAARALAKARRVTGCPAR